MEYVNAGDAHRRSTLTGVCWGISLMARGIHSTDAKAPSPTIGYPDRWEAFNQRHAKFVATCYPDLVDLSKAVLNRHVRITSVADDVIFLLGRTAFEDFCELWVLAGNGYGIGAFKILRGLYEKVVTLGYLVKHPNEIQRFIDYGIVQTMRIMNRAKKQNFTRSKFSDAEYLAAEEAYQSGQGQISRRKRAVVIVEPSRHVFYGDEIRLRTGGDFRPRIRHPQPEDSSINQRFVRTEDPQRRGHVLLQCGTAGAVR
jgi:hypothetical protein